MITITSGISSQMWFLKTPTPTKYWAQQSIVSSDVESQKHILLQEVGGLRGRGNSRDINV